MTTNALYSFAADFVRGIDHYRDVRSEALAEAFRGWFDLSPLPTLDELCAVCFQLEIPVWSLPRGRSEIDGFNFSTPAETAIFIRSDLDVARMETTLSHELREVLENAFIRVKPTYQGRSTSDNRQMNAASDRFGGYLLMERNHSHALAVECGYDLATFAARTARSLPSVIRRAQQLYSAKSDLRAPVMGVWLFEAPWDIVRGGDVAPAELTMAAVAKLGGFTQSKGTPARLAFPNAGASAADFALTASASEEHVPVRSWIREMDLLADGDFLAIAEPIQRFGTTWRVLLTAVRRDGLDQVAPMLQRLDRARSLPDLIRSV